MWHHAGGVVGKQSFPDMNDSHHVRLLSNANLALSVNLLINKESIISCLSSFPTCFPEIPKQKFKLGGTDIMTTLKKLNFITGNKNKLAEVRAILGNAIEVDNQGLDIPEIQGTIEEIAREKCRRAAEVIEGPVLTEDTALEFHALKGLPGPYIKSFLDVLGHEGLNKMLDSFEDKSADAICTFAFCHGPGSEPILFQGRTKGVIVRPRGPSNFGWDPIFEYEGKTYAEMDKEEKNQISHRYKALEKLQRWIVQEKS